MLNRGLRIVGGMVPAVLNLYVDKPPIQLIKHRHPTKQAKGKNRSRYCTCPQRIDFLFSLVEWQCFISYTGRFVNIQV